MGWATELLMEEVEGLVHPLGGACELEAQKSVAMKVPFAAWGLGLACMEVSQVGSSACLLLVVADGPEEQVVMTTVVAGPAGSVDWLSSQSVVRNPD
jgi:hypothetical protein